MKAYEVAERAAEIVEEGWCQGYLVSPEGAHCAVGAANVASGSLTKEISLFDEQYRVLAEAGDVDALHDALIEMFEVIGDFSTIEAWNDAEGRTQSEVADAWRLVAKRLAPSEA